MPTVLFLLLRRLRMPLIVLIISYAVSILGLTLIPGQDDQGQPWRMDFFHAFYFVSFMGSTIGFGEIPYPFTDGQRLWTTFAMYSAVIAWLYAIGAMLATVQSPPFQQALRQAAFKRSVKRIDTPFFLVCGYGDTGSLLVRALVERGVQSVVVDIDPIRINTLETEDLPLSVPGLCANAADSETLKAAGLDHPCCIGLIALTNVDHVNLMAAIASKLISPQLQVICRAETHDSEANMASFGTNYIINPYDSFSERLALALNAPSLFLLTEWLTDDRYRGSDVAVIPPQGRWIVCGYGRCGKALTKHLNDAGLPVTVIEANPKGTSPPQDTVIGRGTEAVTLRQAGVDDGDVAGLVAATDDDANNLSIIMTARELNRDLFTIARQNHRANDMVFTASQSHWLIQPGAIIARKVLSRITTPLLYEFLDTARRQDDAWGKALVNSIGAVVGDEYPHAWAVTVEARQAPALVTMLAQDTQITLEALLKDPQRNIRMLAIVPLLLKRHGQLQLTPPLETRLQVDDCLLFCGLKKCEQLLGGSLESIYTLNYLLTGKTQPQGTIMRWLSGLPPIPKVRA